MFNHILLAADNLDRAKEAARMAGDAARSQPASSLTILVTYPAAPDYLGARESERITAQRQARAETLAESLRREVGAIPGPVQVDLLEGPLAKAAAAASQVRGSDLVIMGTPGLGLWGRLLAWFHTGRILQGTPCPVLTVQ